MGLSTPFAGPKYGLKTRSQGYKIVELSPFEHTLGYRSTKRAALQVIRKERQKTRNMGYVSKTTFVIVNLKTGKETYYYG